MSPASRQLRIQNILVSNILLIIIFYLHHYFIYPLRDKKYGIIKYLGLIVFCLIIHLSLSYILFNRSFDNFRGQEKNSFRPPKPNIMMPILPFALVIVVGFCYRQYMEKVKREKLIKELENIQLKTELAFLSSQIEPHFIFNTLNTMVSMARKKSELLEISLINLSQLMRYMLYSNNGKIINLADEITYIKNYIDLQLIRYKDDVELKLQLLGPFANYNIEPMLLIPFIENAFKHGIGNIEHPIIDISIIIDEKKNIVNMMVTNTITPLKTLIAKDSGIGLNNVKRRLELLYHKKHLLHIEKKKNTFIAMLQINL